MWLSCWGARFEIRSSRVQVPLRTNSAKKKLSSYESRKHFSQSKVLIMKRGSTKQNKNIQKCFAVITTLQFEPSYA